MLPLPAISTPSALSGPFELPGPLGSGETVFGADLLIADEKTAGDTEVTFLGAYYPDTTETHYGPYALGGRPTPVRFSARQVRVLVQGVELDDWRWGEPRLRANPRGAR